MLAAVQKLNELLSFIMLLTIYMCVVIFMCDYVLFCFSLCKSTVSVLMFVCKCVCICA